MLTPDRIITAGGVLIRQKLIPDGTVWQSDIKARAAGFAAGELYKAQRLVSGGTGRVAGVTIHNTPDLASVADDAEQYVRATFNENMGAARVHFFLDENGAWQNLRAGTGIGDDPVGSAEVGWHAGDGATGTGNNTTIAIECIMGESAVSSDAAEENAVKLAAWLLYIHGLEAGSLFTHNHWMGQDDRIIYGARKNCPLYLLDRWEQFRGRVAARLAELRKGGDGTEMEKDNVPADWAAEAVNWAVGNGLLVGDEDGDLRLGDAVTRQELCVLLRRFDQLGRRD